MRTESEANVSLWTFIHEQAIREAASKVGESHMTHNSNSTIFPFN